ncbi:MAG: DUF2604 domain-containing protein [Chloroflexota bacterium]|nr:DUF2604 domain-containing protein [Chloroflexota bacterium]
MPDNKLTLRIIVNGNPVAVDANVNAPLRTVVPKALELGQVVGQPAENWELRDAAGNLLDLAQKIEDFGFAEGVTLSLSLKAGVGG